MSPYKSWLNATRAFFNSNGFLRFLLTAYIGVFALGGVLFILGEFLFVEALTCLGVPLMLAGLFLTLVKEDAMTLAITSAAISFLSLLAWILAIAGVLFGGGVIGGLNNALGELKEAFGGDFGGVGFGVFVFTTLFYFAAFGFITVFTFLKADKFKQMRAASAARSQMAGVACQRCGSFVPMNSGFCPTCGAPNPMAQQAPPQYAPPAQQYAPPAPPVQPAPAAAEPAAGPKCVSCGADIPAGAAFCAHCGSKQ
jgi:hypothetical protein